MKNEEAKQRAKNYMSLKGALEPNQIKCYCGHTIMCDCSPIDEPKQETLEEAAETISDYIKRVSKSANESVGIMKGAKWQQERMYSEEEVKTMFNRFTEFISHHDIEEWQNWIDKQFKKK